MPRLQLVSDTDSLNLDDVLSRGVGVQALTGTSGLGLPPVSVQWLEGAGDGAVYRGRRVLPRDIDLPLHVKAINREHLKELVSRLALMLAGPCTLRLVEDDGTDWSTRVVRVGGGTYTYGVDTTGTDDLSTVITLRAGDPFWTYSRSTSKTVQNAGRGRGLLKGLARMRVASSQTIGRILLENRGNAPAYPVWEIQGPGSDFKAESRGQRLHWTGVLRGGETLTVDTRAGTVIDGAGANRYAELAPAPRFWAIPPGTSEAVASLDNAGTGQMGPIGDPIDRNFVTNPRFEAVNAATPPVAIGQAGGVTAGSSQTFFSEGPPGGRFGRWRTPAGSATATFRIARSTALSRADITAGQPYTLVVRMRLLGWPPGTVPLRIAPGQGTPVVLANTNIAGVGPDWRDVRVPFVAAINAAADANIGLYVSLPLAAPAGVDGVFDIAHWGLFAGTFAGPYFDGDSANTLADGWHAWTGARHSSTSTRSLASAPGRSSITCTFRPRQWMVI